MTSLPVENKRLEIKARLGLIPYNIDAHENAHITIDQHVCEDCPDHMCMFACPAECFYLQEWAKKPGKSVMHFRYEDCVECGTCHTMCTHGSVKWSNPRGGFGVKYQYG